MGSGLITSHSKHLLGNISAPLGPRKTPGYIKKVTVQSRGSGQAKIKQTPDVWICWTAGSQVFRICYITVFL